MVRVPVRNHRPRHRPNRIDEKIPGLTIQTLGANTQPSIGMGHAFLTAQRTHIVPR